MKKYSIIGLSLSIFLIAVIICFCIRDKYELMTYEIATDTFVFEYRDHDIETKLDMDLEWLKEYKVLVSLSNLEYERILLFHVQEGYMEQVKKKVDAYMVQLQTQFSNKSKEIKQYTKEFAKDDNYIVVVSKKANTIIEKLKERLIE